MNEKIKLISITLIIAGIIGILSSIIVTPDFAAKYISQDNDITTEGVKLLQLYRLLSLISGCLMLFIAVILYKFPERILAFPEFAYKAFFIMIIVYLVLFGFNTMTRTHDFSDPDTKNFVDIARNISTGRGVTQSALGFNQTEFSADDQIPMPLTAQPPLYPLLIVLFSLIGLPLAEAGLLISIICYGLILLLAYKLSFKMYDLRAALLSAVFLLLYGPLYNVSKTALSEPLSIVFLLTSFLILIQMSRSTIYHMWVPAVAGLTTGLAFATRYAFLPLFPLCILFILSESNRKLRDICLYMTGFAIPAGLVLIRNLFVSGAILSSRNPSNISFKNNALQVFEVLIREYSYMLKPDIQAILIIIFLLILIIILSIRHKLLISIKAVFIEKGGYLLTLWVLGYLTFLIVVRTKVHLDFVSWRLVMPAGVIMCLLLSALTVKSIEIKTKHLIYFGMLIALVLIVREAKVTVKMQAYNQEQVIARSERLNWIAKNTTKHDLIIGHGTIDIAFYFGYPDLISFQYYPENNVLDYKKVMAFTNKNCNKYNNVYLMIIQPSKAHLNYLIMYTPDIQKANPDNQTMILKYLYGPFVSDILSMNLLRYPDVAFLEHLSDNTYIYKITCRLHRQL